MVDKAVTLLLSFEWIEAKLKATGAPYLINNYHKVMAAVGNEVSYIRILLFLGLFNSSLFVGFLFTIPSFVFSHALGCSFRFSLLTCYVINLFYIDSRNLAYYCQVPNKRGVLVNRGVRKNSKI